MRHYAKISEDSVGSIFGQNGHIIKELESRFNVKVDARTKSKCGQYRFVDINGDVFDACGLLSELVDYVGVNNIVLSPNLAGRVYVFAKSKKNTSLAITASTAASAAPIPAITASTSAIPALTSAITASTSTIPASTSTIPASTSTIPASTSEPVIPESELAVPASELAIPALTSAITASTSEPVIPKSELAVPASELAIPDSQNSADPVPEV